jgi:hypothetical protein
LSRDIVCVRYIIVNTLHKGGEGGGGGGRGDDDDDGRGDSACDSLKSVGKKYFGDFGLYCRVILKRIVIVRSLKLTQITYEDSDHTAK